AVIAPPALPPPPMASSAARAAATQAETEAMQEVPVTGSRILQASVSNRYAAGTQLQAGPGVPDWRYNSYSFGWSGPVEPQQGVRFVWLGPVATGIWRILGERATVLFALRLARTASNLPLDSPGFPAGLRRALARGGAVVWGG